MEDVSKCCYEVYIGQKKMGQELLIPDFTLIGTKEEIVTRPISVESIHQ